MHHKYFETFFLSFIKKKKQMNTPNYLEKELEIERKIQYVQLIKRETALSMIFFYLPYIKSRTLIEVQKQSFFAFS